MPDMFWEVGNVHTNILRIFVNINLQSLPASVYGRKDVNEYTLTNAIPKHTGPEAEGSNPTTGLTLLWARNPFGGNFNHWQVSRKEAGQIFFLFVF